MYLTCFEHWQRWHPNYGSFQTKLFLAYEVADSRNMEKLQTVFPHWFCVAKFHDEETIRIATGF